MKTPRAFHTSDSAVLLTSRGLNDCGRRGGVGWGGVEGCDGVGVHLIHVRVALHL